MAAARLLILALVCASVLGCNDDALDAPSVGRTYRAPLGNDDSALLSTRAFNGATGKRRVPADFKQVELSMKFDVSSATSLVTARIRFQSHERGYPFFLMTPSPRNGKLNGSAVSFGSGTDPDGETQLRLVEAEVQPGENTLEFDYSLGAEVSFRTGGLGFLTSMADIASGNFFEAYGPANFEADQYQMTMELKIDGATQDHRLFTNAAVATLGEKHWRLEFPAYYNTSAFYVHLTDAALSVRETSYNSIDGRVIPITIYSQSSSSADSGLSLIKGFFAELEQDYGAYPHASFVAYINGAGGMEHSGATITSVSALDHELAHSFFGRGVMPSEGRSGWIDEALASWRDYGYQRASTMLSRSATNLADLSIYEIFTPSNCYTDGRALFAELDRLFPTGLKHVMRRWFEKWNGRVVTTEIFRDFLIAETGVAVDPHFNRYVYGGAPLGAAKKADLVEDSAPVEYGKHPRPLTREEALSLR